MKLNPYLGFRENFSHEQAMGNVVAPDDPTLAQAWVAFDYGDGGFNSDQQLRPGFANESIAAYLKRHAMGAHYDTRQQRGVWQPKKPIYAQVLVAAALQEMCPGLEESDMFVIVGKPTNDGSYIDSWAVAVEAAQHIAGTREDNSQALEDKEQQQSQAQAKSIGKVAVVAVQQHAWRTRWQTQRAFDRQTEGRPNQTKVEVFKPAGLPKEYADPDSTQEWTKRALAWWPRELAARGLAFLWGGPVKKPEEPKNGLAGWVYKTFDH